jgi:hypothetical protein
MREGGSMASPAGWAEYRWPEGETPLPFGIRDLELAVGSAYG